MAERDQDEEALPPSRVVVIQERYCTSQPLDLLMKKRLTNLKTNAIFEILDSNQNLLLKVEGLNVLIHRKFLMTDSNDFPVITLHEARRSDKHRWEIYQGDSTDVHDYLFKIQRIRSRSMQFKTRLDVFLREHENTEEGSFHVVKEDVTTHRATMYQGTRMICQVEHTNTWRSFIQGKDMLKIRICEGVDYAFVMAVVVVMVSTIETL